MKKSPKSLQLILEETTWFKSLPRTSQEQVLLNAYECHYCEGEVVARIGDVASSWIGVAEGLLKIVTVHRTGRVVMLTGIPAGGWVGEGSVLKRIPRQYDIVAMRNSRLIFLPGPTFRYLLDSSIEFNHIVLERLNERLSQFIKMVDIDRLNDPTARVARSIATLYNPVIYPGMSNLIQLSHSELGELIGMSRQSVGAALKTLEAEGLIAAVYGGVVVKELDSLSVYRERER